MTMGRPAPSTNSIQSNGVRNGWLKVTVGLLA